MAISIHQGVLFSDKPLPGTPKGQIKVEISGQNTSLVDIKEDLAKQAKACGANAVANLQYFQKGHKPLQHLTFRWDTESQFGFGDAVLIPKERMNDALNGATE